MTIEEYMKRLGFPVFEEENHLMIATTERFFYGAGVVLYPGFLDSISGGKDLYMIPSSVHEWLYIEDCGAFTKESLMEMLRTVNREVVEADEFFILLEGWRVQEGVNKVKKKINDNSGSVVCSRSFWLSALPLPQLFSKDFCPSVNDLDQR